MKNLCMHFEGYKKSPLADSRNVWLEAGDATPKVSAEKAKEGTVKNVDILELQKKYEDAEKKVSNSKNKLDESIEKAEMALGKKPEGFTGTGLDAKKIIEAMAKVEKGENLPNELQSQFAKEVSLRKEWLEAKTSGIPPFRKTNEEKFPEEAKAMRSVIDLLDGSPSALEQRLKEQQNKEVEFKKIEAEFLQEGGRANESLSGSMERFFQTSRTLETFKNSPHFRDIESNYNSAVTGLIQSADYACFREDQDRVENAQSAREYRELFMALMATETKDFSTDFILGDTFKPGNSPETIEENKKNFADIYAMVWEKENGEDTSNKMEIAKGEVREIGKKADTLKIGDDVSGKINAGTTVKLNLPDLTQEPKNAEEAKKIQKTIADFASAHKNQKEVLERAIPGYDKRFEGDQVKLKEYATWASKWVEVFDYQKALGEIDQNFTKEKLGKSVSSQKLMELCLVKFKKAAEVVDGASGEFGGQFNPAVRRLLITLIYRQGTKEMVPTKSGQPWFDHLSDNYATILRELVGSDQFNINNKENALTQEQTAFLTYAIETGIRMGKNAEKLKMSEAFREINTPAVEAYVKSIEEFLKTHSWEDYEKVEKGDPTASGEAKADYKVVSLKKAEYEKDVGDTKDANGHTKDEIVGYKKFLVAQKIEQLRAENQEHKRIKEYLKDPKNPKSQEWLNGIVADPRNGEGMKKSQNTELIYRTLELKDRGPELALKETLGIDFHSIYENYKNIIADPKMSHLKVENWPELMHSTDKNAYQEFVDFMGKIVPEDEHGGKKKFLFALKNMTNEPLLALFSQGGIEHNDPRAAAMGIVGAIETNIREKSKVESNKITKGFEYKARLEGKTLSDKGMEYMGMGWDMLRYGSWQEKAAAAFLFYGLYKTGRWAFGEKSGTGGWLIKGGLGVLALDILKKKGTGKGVFESLKLNNISNTFEGTMEAALVKHGRDICEKSEIPINEEQQHETLKQVKNIPIGQLLEWYKDVGGPPPSNKIKPRAGERDLFRSLRPGISTSSIFEHNKSLSQDPDLVGRWAVYKTIQTLCDYVGKRDGQSSDFGMKTLEARWINPLKPGGSMEPNGWAKWMPKDLLEKYKNKPGGITWDLVMNSEINVMDAMKTIDDNMWAQGANGVKNLAKTGIDFFRKDIAAPTKEKVKEYLNTTRFHYAPEVENWALDMASKGADKISFGMDRVSAWYGPLEIRRFVGKHVDLALEGLKLPFEIAYVLDDKVIEWTDTKFNRLRQLVIRKYGRGVEIPVAMMNEKINDTNFFDNPYYAEHLGSQYKENFKKAWNSGPEKRYTIDEIGLPSDLVKKTEDAVWQKALAEGKAKGGKEADINREAEKQANEAVEALKKFSAQKLGSVAYFAVEMDAKEVPANITSPYNRHQYMKVQSEQKAREKIMDILKKEGREIPTDTEDYLNKYLYSISEVTTIGGTGPGQPDKLTTFFRIPLANSREFIEKEMGNWSDTKNPRTLKNSAPFFVETDEDLFTNLKKVFGEELDFAKPGLKPLAIALAEFIRLGFGTAETLSFKHITFPESTREKIDELMFTAEAESGTWALSAKYGGGTFEQEKDGKRHNFEYTLEKATKNREEFRKVQLAKKSGIVYTPAYETPADKGIVVEKPKKEDEKKPTEKPKVGGGTKPKVGGPGPAPKGGGPRPVP